MTTRDVCFWAGLALIGVGLWLRFSAGVASVTIGALLFAVAVFGIASTRR